MHGNRTSVLIRPKMAILYGHVGYQVHARTYGAGAEYSSCITFVVYSTVGRTCSKKTACLNFLCLFPMVLKTKGLGTGATFMRGSYMYVAEFLPGFINALC